MSAATRGGASDGASGGATGGAAPPKARPGSLRALEGLQPALGHRFQRIDLLAEALTHPSAAGPARPDNQRLEFLGDRVLGLVIAEVLMEALPGEAEGRLAPRLNALVRRETLAEVANELGLGAHLVLGRSENTSGGRRKKAILADATEALIAALYLDGGLEAARAFVTRHWAHRITATQEAPIDAKTRLQEWAQARGLPPPDYSLVARRGPDHAPDFTVAVTLSDGTTDEGLASTKKAAEQMAAEAMLSRLEPGVEAKSEPRSEPRREPGSEPGETGA